MKTEFRACTMTDLAALQILSRDTYSCTFGYLNTEANMNAYLEHAFNSNRLADELANEYSSFYFLYVDDELAGYMKINEHQAQTEIHDPQSIEIERIYVTQLFQGNGLGGYLLNQATKIARRKSKSYIWLGVWEKNEKAIQFYKRNGFYVIGKHPFIMGDEEQSDFLMRKDLN